MNAIKERLIGAITVMSIDEAEKLWNLVLSDYNSENWESVDEVEPTVEEINILKAYYDGSDDLQAIISHEELKKKLNRN